MLTMLHVLKPNNNWVFFVSPYEFLYLSPTFLWASGSAIDFNPLLIVFSNSSNELDL